MLETSLQELVTPSAYKRNGHGSNTADSHSRSSTQSNNEYGTSLADFSQTEIAKLSRVENRLDQQWKQRLLQKKSYWSNKLSFVQFSMMIFVIICVGPFGIESSIHSVGFLYTLLGLLIVPFIYAIPQSLMSSELTSILPSNHGYIAWVYRAFYKVKYGDLLGFVHGLNCVISQGIELPIYIVLLYEYLQNLILEAFQFDLHPFYTQYLSKILFIALGAILNIANIKLLGTTSILIAFAVLTPFLIGFCYGVQHTDLTLFHSTTTTDGDMNWTLALSTLMWLYSGIDIMCMCAGEIRVRKTQLHVPFIMAILTSLLVYSLTLLTATTYDCHTAVQSQGTDEWKQCWSDGYLSVVYDELLHSLGIFVSIAAILCMFGKYIIYLSAHARSLWAISQPYITIQPNGCMYISEYDAEMDDDDDRDEQTQFELLEKSKPHGNERVHLQHELETVVSNIAFDDVTNFQLLQKIRIRILPQHFVGTVWDKTQAPVRAVLLATIINAILVMTTFEVLVEISVFLNCFTFMFKSAAFLRLKYHAPNIRRPFAVCGGMVGACVIVFCQLAVVVLVIVVAIHEQPVLFIMAIAINVVVVIWYLLTRYSSWRTAKDSLTSLISKDDDETPPQSQNHSHSGYNTTTTVKNIW